MNTKIPATFLMALMLFGCAQAPKLTATGQDSYWLEKRSRTALGKGIDLLQELYVDAKVFCENQGKKMVLVNEFSSDGILFIDFAHARLQFECQPKVGG